MRTLYSAELHCCCFFNPLQLLGEREELQRQLMDIHQQRQDALGASQEITMKFDSTQQEVCLHKYDAFLHVRIKQ